MSWRTVASPDTDQRTMGDRSIRRFWILLVATLFALPWLVNSHAQDDINALLAKAKEGEAIAQERLAWLYQTGRGVESNAVKAVHWYTLAAEQGRADAQNNLGLLYQFGFADNPPNFDIAASWFRVAADRGHSHAMYNLGVLWRTGDGVAVDYAESSRLFLEAALQGFIPAQTAIAEALVEGRGVVSDKVEALKWSIIASDALDQSAHTIRRNLERTMKPQQIQESERRARRFVEMTRQ